MFTLTVETRAKEGVKKIPPPNPVRKPCVSMSCQYFVEMLMRNIPRTCSTAPTNNDGTKYPASRSRPEKTPPTIVSQICKDPIQDIVDGDISVMVSS